MSRGPADAALRKPVSLACALLVAVSSFAPAAADLPPGEASFAKALETLERTPADRTIVELRNELVDALQDGGLPIHEARGAVPPPRLPKLDEQLPVEARRARWRRLARERIEGFRDASLRPVPIPGDPADVRDRVLRDPVFASETEDATLWERIRQRIFRLLGPKLAGVANWIGENGTAVAIGIVALAVAIAVWLLIRTVRLERTAVAAFEDERLEVAREASTGYWLERADAAFREGRIGEALRAWVAASRASLTERELLPLRRGLTERECVALLGRSAGRETTDAFRTLADLHERVVYAGLEADREVGERAKRAVDAIVAAEAPS